MQEIVLLFGSVAGACTAVAVSKIKRTKIKEFSFNANSRIKNEIESLKIEKEILTKTISQLYDNKSEFSETQREKLLVQYQHQLGLVIAKIEKLEVANKFPELGPIGDGLITLLDQKLSKLDNRLHEISSKIMVTDELSKVKHVKAVEGVKETVNTNLQNKLTVFQQPSTISRSPQPHKSVEITTLTELPRKMTEFPFKETKPISVKKPIIEEEMIEQTRPIHPEKVEIIQSTIGKSTLEKTDVEIPKPNFRTPHVERKPEPVLNIPEDDKDEDDDNDLTKIKNEIAKTLSRLEQAEVE